MTADLSGRKWLHAAGGFLLMGGWAMFANRAHPWPAVISGGLVQGVLSACITLVMKKLVEALVAQLYGMNARLVPPVACFALSVGLLSLAHNLAGTPEILATMFVPVTVATSYAFLYTQKVVADRGASHERSR